jgi:GTP-binding protein HflX
LVESFKSTLDEVKESDILLHVVDVSHPNYEDQMKVVNTTLAELGCADKPTVTIFNKMDVYEKQTFDEWLEEDVKHTILKDLKKRWENETLGACIFISATEKREIDTLRTNLLQQVRKLYSQRYPYKTAYYSHADYTEGT